MFNIFKKEKRYFIAMEVGLGNTKDLFHSTIATDPHGNNPIDVSYDAVMRWSEESGIERENIKVTAFNRI